MEAASLLDIGCMLDLDKRHDTGEHMDQSKVETSLDEMGMG